MKIAISRLHFPVTTLGPGRRIGIWLQGCSIRCAGCISADTWGFGRGQTTVSDVTTVIKSWMAEADGITISGGEPFDQAEALGALLKEIRQHDVKDVLVYSGYSFDYLAGQLTAMEGLIDALITDPFNVNGPQTLALRGSDNQQFHCLTETGRRRLKPYDRPLRAEDHVLDLMCDDNGTIWIAGIPQRGDMLRLQTLLSAQGHELHTTDEIRKVRSLL